MLKEGCNATTIHQCLVAMYSYSVPNYPMVTRWFNEFKRGRQFLEDDPRSGRPSDAVNPMSVAAVERLILTNRIAKVSEIVKELQVTAWSVDNIIHQHLHMSKVSFCWVSQKLCQHDRHEHMAWLYVRSFWICTQVTKISPVVVWSLGMKHAFTTGIQQAN